MKSRKLISFLGAAAMAASAFSGLTLTASAADGDVLFSSDFEGSTTATGWTMSNGSARVLTDSDGNYLQLQGSGGGNRTSTYALGSTISGQYVIEFDTLMTRGNGMGRIMHSNQVAFTDDTTNMDTRDGASIVETVNTEQSANYQSGAGSSAANAALKIDLRPYLDNQWMINDDSTSDLVAYPEEAVDVTDNQWVRVQAAVNGNTTTVTVIDNAGTRLVDGVAYSNASNEISSIYVVSNRGDSGSGIIALDNINIYEGPAQALDTDGLRGESTAPSPSPTATAVPVVDPVAAPVLTAPENVTAGDSFDFNSVEETEWAFGTAAQEITSIDGMTINIGGRSGGDSGVLTSASVVNYGGNNVLRLQGGNYSTAGRGPVVSLNNNLDISSDTTQTAVMTFEAFLTNAAPGGAGRLYLLKDNVQTGDKADGAYRNVMAVLTTDGTGSTIYRGDDTSANVIGIDVTSNEWHTVTVMVSDGRYRVFIDNATDPAVVGEYVATGDNASTVTALPMLAVTSAASNGTHTSSIVMIDNMLTYTGVLGERASDLFPIITEPEEPSATPAPVVTMTVDETAQSVSLTSDVDATVALVQASYVTDGTLDSIKVVPVTLTADTADVSTVADGDLDAFQTNDKFMVVDSLDSMRPLSVAYTVSGGAEQTTPAPTPTVEATTEPTEAASAEPSEEATTAPSEEATTAPSEEATTAPSEEAYVDEDFESYTAGTVDATSGASEGATAIASIPGFSGSTSAVVVGAEGQGNVLWLRGGGAWTPENTITESIKMDFDIHYGYYSGNNKTEIWNITNSNGDIIASVTYDATSCAITEVTIGGQTMDLTGVISVQDGNDFNAQNSKAHTTVVLDTTNKTLKITLTKGDQSSEFTGSLGEMTADFASWNFTNNVNYHTRCSTIDNFVVQPTTETVEVSE